MRRLITATLLVSATLAANAPLAHAAESCPNAAYRTGAGANLPDCRAWEQVTPAQKNGQQPDTTKPAYPSPSGDRVIFNSRGGIAPTDGTPFIGVFSSLRGGSAWSALGVDGPIDSKPGGFVLAGVTQGYSDDRSKALVVSLRKLTPDAVEGASNVYARDTADRSVSLLASAPGKALYYEYSDGNSPFHFYGATPDFSRVALATGLALAPGATEYDSSTGAANLYMVGGGQISLINRDVDETVLRSYGFDTDAQRVSEDGRRVTFLAFRADSPLAGLFQRADGTTKLIARSHRMNESKTEAVATSGAAWPSADGTRVIFSRSLLDPLTDDGPGPLYRWSAEDDELVSLLKGVPTPWSARADSPAILNVSRDERYVWFQVGDIDSDDRRINRVYVLDTSLNRLTLKATFEDFTGTGFPDGLGLMDFSGDGTKMVGTTPANLTGYDQTNSACQPSGRCAEAYYFDATQPDASPVCVSCGPAGTESLGDAGLGGYAPSGAPTADVVSNSGQVFFDTKQRLVPGDANDLSDVYEYTPGRGVSLLSSGTGDYPAEVIGSNRSGNDVLFRTIDRLVPQDADFTSDIYDARVGGGLAGQQAPPGRVDACPTGDCPAGQLAAPPAIVPGSSTLQAPPRPPAFSVARVSASARRAAAASGRLAVAVRIGAAGRLSARADARVGRRSVSAARTTLVAREAGRFTLTLKLSRSARRALTRERTLQVKLAVSYSRAAKPSSQTVQLSALRARSSAKGGAR